MLLLIDPKKGDFGLELSHGPRTENPADMFQSLAGLIRAFDEIDREFAHTIDVELNPRLVLQTIEIGSLRIWLSSRLRSIPDELIKDGDWNKIVGFFLFKAKHKIIQWLDGKETIKSVDDIQDVRREITELKNEVERLRQFPVETPIPVTAIVAALKNISMALSLLPPGQSIAYVSSEGSLEINRSFTVTDEQIERVLTKTLSTEHARMALTIKKPDYLGKSMWDVIAQGRTVKAKIVDEQWLKTFHHRQVALLPGDALSTEVRIDTHFDEEGRKFETKYTVERVHEVVKFNRQQLELFRNEGDDAHDDEATQD